MILISLCAAIAMSPGPEPSRVDKILDIADGVLVDRLDKWFQDGEWSRALHGARYRSFAFPYDYDAVTDYGFLLENMEREPEALAVYQKFHVDNPLDKDAWLAEITFHFVRKHYQQVIELTEPRLARKPHPNHYRMLGQSYEKLNRLEDAERVFRVFVRDFPNDETAKANLNRILNKRKTGTS